MSQLIRKYFNEKDADKLYALTGVEFRKIISLEKLKEIGASNLFPLGEMKPPHFESNTNGISKYKVDFTNGTLSMLLSLDDSDKIGTFLFQQYTEEKKKETKAASTNSLSTHWI